MNFFAIILLIVYLIVVVVIELILISYYRSKAKTIYLEKLNTPCGNCFKESAYQKLLDRKGICKAAYILCNKIPPALYSSHRKRAIAEEVCKKFYTHLKDYLETI